MSKKQEETRRILLEVRVFGDGTMVLESTGDKVLGKALGEPRIIEISAFPRGTGEDPFTERIRLLNKEAPELANAYSPGRNWDDSEDNSSFYQREQGGDPYFFQTIQYIELDQGSIKLARSKIG